MISNTTKIRVRYGETDKMGVVYYGAYPLYLEVARTELLRKYGIAYKNLEKNGIQLPVIHLECSYIKPAFYDDIIKIKATIKELKGSKLTFEYVLLNNENQIINKSTTTLIFLNSSTGKPCRPPEIINKKLSNI